MVTNKVTKEYNKKNGKNHGAVSSCETASQVLNGVARYISLQEKEQKIDYNWLRNTNE